MSFISCDAEWIIQEPQQALANQLAAEHGLSPVVAQCLINRGLTESGEIHQHLNGRLADLPDPMQIPGIQDACRVLIEAIEQGQRVALFGDYDVDGMTGCAILSQFLKHCRLDVDVFIPDRIHDGYGVSIAGLERIKATGADVVVTIDNGTSAFEELEWARANGLRVIVVDHHESPTKIPPCEALVNPKHPESLHPDKTLCSAGLVFNLVIALRAQLRAQDFFRGRSEPDLKEELDLACLGTVADMVPLLGQNRLLVRYGLQILETGQRPGIAALKAVTSTSGRAVDTWEVGFQIAPRLNAAGRMADARLGVQLLTTQDRREADHLAQHLDQLNQERRKVEAQMIAEAIAQVESQDEAHKQWAIVVAADQWHPGVMGIVAAKLTEHFKRPAIVIALQGDVGVGSARTYGGVSVYDAIAACSEHLLRYGGHQAAAGLKIDAAQLTDFTVALQAAVAALAPEGFRATLKIDQVLTTAEICEQVVNDLIRIGPYGMGFRAPLFVTESVRLVSPRILGDQHLKVTVAGESRQWSAIGFNLAAIYESQREAEFFRLAYRPEWNEFRGQRSIQLKIQQIQAAR